MTVSRLAPLLQHLVEFAPRLQGRFDPLYLLARANGLALSFDFRDRSGPQHIDGETGHLHRSVGRMPLHGAREERKHRSAVLGLLVPGSPSRTGRHEPLGLPGIRIAILARQEDCC